MIDFSRGYLLPFLLFNILLNGFSQERTDAKYYDLFDQEVGIENTDLYQGLIYTVEYRTNTEKTQFYKNRDFSKGSVKYDEQWYNELDLKYDLYEDRILLKLARKAGGGTLILLNEMVEGFEIVGNDFIKIAKEDAPEIGVYGFYEVSLKSPSFMLYTKFVKKRFKKKERKSVYYEFTDGPSTYVLHFNKKYTLLKSKSDVIKLFPELKKDIDQFYNVARRLRKSKPDDFQVALVKRIEILLSQMANKS